MTWVAYTMLAPSFYGRSTQVYKQLCRGVMCCVGTKTRNLLCPTGVSNPGAGNTALARLSHSRQRPSARFSKPAWGQAGKYSQCHLSPTQLKRHSRWGVGCKNGGPKWGIPVHQCQSRKFKHVIPSLQHQARGASKHKHLPKASPPRCSAVSGKDPNPAAP